MSFRHAIMLSMRFWHDGAVMKKATYISSILSVLALMPHVALAKGDAYFGVAMMNSTYSEAGHDHRSMGRLGYDINRYVAVETHFGGTVGGESNVSDQYGQAQMIDQYSAFLCFNSHFGNKRLYVLGGVTYGTRELQGPNSSVAVRNNDSNKSFGMGIEAYENDDISFQLEWVRYFDNRYYTVDAWNLGLVTRF